MKLGERALQTEHAADRVIPMSAIFVSYKREDLAKVEPLVGALRNAGLSLWWDQDISPDAPWEATIERELDAAPAVIVAWSQAAVASDNVKAEARRARNQGKLIQVFVEPCDPPLFFGERQGVDLSDWHGEAKDHRFQSVLTAARAIVAGNRPPPGVGYIPSRRAPWVVPAAVFLSTVLAMISNFGGVRDALCSTTAVHEACVRAGIVTQQPRGPSLAEQQRRLVQTISGRWARGDRDCSTALDYAVEEYSLEHYRIRGTAPGFDTTLQVEAIDPSAGLVTARETRPGPSGLRQSWEFRPSGDVLDIKDQAGTSTPLARC